MNPRGVRPQPLELRPKMVALLVKRPELRTIDSIALHVDESVRWSA